jgi:exonuclease SbcD
MIKILHTSDWHLGRTLYGRKRYDEFSAFLDWLALIITNENIDVLLIAGDIFDTSTPSNRAQELYYRFLCRVSNSCCRHIVVIAGNHDSPSFLNAPRELLHALNVYVIGAITANPAAVQPRSYADEVIVLKDEKNRPEAIICAVPYLRDRDIRTVEPGETIDDKNAKLAAGLRNHYTDVCTIAVQKRDALKENGHSPIPIIAMGHLFTAGGKTVDGDGVRELYVGNLAHISADAFPDSIDYLALGHLHVPQQIGGAAHMRYCGSPLPMGYGEAAQPKKVVLVEFTDDVPVTAQPRPCSIRELDIPCFQPLERIAGSLDEIRTRIAELKQHKSKAWLEIEYKSADVIGNLREILDKDVDDSGMEIRRIRNRQFFDRVINKNHVEETLDDLDVNDVFARCLDAFEVPATDRPELINSYQEIIHDLLEEDKNAS